MPMRSWPTSTSFSRRPPGLLSDGKECSAVTRSPSSAASADINGSRCGYLPQEPLLDPELTVHQEVESRVALCKLLLSKPDMLLLDEPTNHLDAESVEWLEQFLVRFPGTVVAVTHDRYFLDNAAEWILELDRGEGIPWKGNYSSWLEQKEARLARFEELSSVEYQKRNETQEIFIPVGERLGSKVIEFKEVSKAFGERLLIDKLSFSVPPGAIVGIIGPNGAGKSTLFRMLTGQEKPDSGEVEIGSTVKLAYVDQSRDCLDGNKTVFEEISGGADLLTVGKYETRRRAPTLAASTSRVRTSRNSSASSPAANAAACTWRRR